MSHPAPINVRRRLKSGTAGISTPITSGTFSGVRWDDATAKTDASGKFTFTASSTSVGEHVYYVTFPSDNSYLTATSNLVTIDGHNGDQPTTLSPQQNCATLNAFMAVKQEDERQRIATMAMFAQGPRGATQRWRRA